VSKSTAELKVESELPSELLLLTDKLWPNFASSSTESSPAIKTSSATVREFPNLTKDRADTLLPSSDLYTTLNV
jgi:hypothetical protein